MEKKLSAAEVRLLPEGSKVTICTTDKYGYPARGTAFVHVLPTGKKVLHPIGFYSNGFIEIRNRKGQEYTVEVKDDDDTEDQ